MEAHCTSTFQTPGFSRLQAGRPECYNNNKIFKVYDMVGNIRL